VSILSITRDFDMFKDRRKCILMKIISFHDKPTPFSTHQKTTPSSHNQIISLAGNALAKTVLALFFSKVRASILDTSNAHIEGLYYDRQ